jgi:RloB-like protein
VTPVVRRRHERRREIVILTEGEVTEVCYFDAIKRLQDRLVVRVDDRHGNPQTLIPLAIDIKRTRDRQSEDEDLPIDERAQVWCAFDRDEHIGIDSLMERADKAGVRVAFSHPCFELWLLLHFQAYGAPALGACGPVTAAVCATIKDYKRRGKRVSLNDLVGRYAQARERAVLLDRQHDRDGLSIPSQRDPSTGVFQLVDAMGVTY